MRQDPREEYLRRIMAIDRTSVSSFKLFMQYAELILQGDGSRDVDQLHDMVDLFRFRFRTEKGVPTIDMILFNMDIARVIGRKYVKIKTFRTVRKFRYLELLIELQEIEGEVWRLIREKVKHIRILTPTNIP